MAKVLDQIVARKRETVARRKRERPLEQLRSAVAPSTRSLKAALRSARTGFLLECKPASPSAGVLRSDYDPRAIAKSYAPFADGISVLTDEPFFSGSLEHLSAVRDVVDQPLLCKDFVIDPYQLVEARSFGADAVLLMLSLLDDAELERCLDLANQLSLDALVEVHDEQQLARARAAGAELIGINNRDLRDLSVSFAPTERLAPKLGETTAAVIAESGIRDHGDARRLRGSVDGFLVGSSLMKRSDIDRAVRELIFGRVKICGLTREEDARAAWAAGAIFGGLVFHPGSPRAVDEATAHRLRAAAPLDWVGVFVNEPPERVARLAAALELHAVQLHGEETPAHIAQTKSLVPDGCEVWKAHRVRADLPVPTAEQIGADRLLLDAFSADRRGGTGERFDWQRIADHPERDQLVVAGGIGPERGPQADALGVYALDASSALEHAPGQKDHGRIAALLAALRGRSR